MSKTNGKGLFKISPYRDKGGSFWALMDLERDGRDSVIEIFRKIFDDFSNGFNFKDVVYSLVANVPEEFSVGTKKFIL